MNVSVGSKFRHAGVEVLARGTLVSFILPFATTLELTGRLKGVVISDAHHNRAGRPGIVPITYGESPVNEALGIQINKYNGVPGYLRPDLTTFICMSYGQVEPIIRRDTMRECMLPRSLVCQASETFLDIIRPTQAKLLQPGRGFLPYGQIGWTEACPRAQENKLDRAPILNLTPPEVYEQTRMVLLVRAYSNVGLYSPVKDIAVSAVRWFDTGFFSVADVKPLPVKDALALHSGCKPVPAGDRALRGFVRKQHGRLDTAVYGQILKRYNQSQGTLPPHVNCPRKNVLHYTY